MTQEKRYLIHQEMYEVQRRIVYICLNSIKHWLSMKKVLFVLFALAFLSCEKISTDNFETSIIGTWQLVKGEWYDDGVTRTRDYINDEEYKEELQYWIFQEDGQLIVEYWDRASVETDDGRYRIAGDVLYTDITESILTINKLTKNEMVLDITYSYHDTGTLDGRVFFKKKK